MTVYFKATRLDGTDFRTGTVDYGGALESGTQLPLLTSADGYACCTDTVYHASDVPAETLVGGSWPCRLFEVTGDPVAQEDHKFGFRTLTVTREIPAWQALGPNGGAVAALIERAARLTEGEASSLIAARASARDAVGAAAWDAAGAAAWDAAGDAARVAAGDAAWVAAWAAAWVAARALVVRDLITEEQFGILYGPWQSVVGDG